MQEAIDRSGEVYTSVETAKPVREAGRWWRWILFLPAGSIAYLFMTMFFDMGLRAVFPNSAFLWELEHAGFNPVGLEIAKSAACFYAIMAAAYAAPKRHFLAALLFTIPALLLLPIVVLLTPFLTPEIFHMGFGTYLAFNIETIAFPLVALTACWVVHYAERRSSDPESDGEPAWKVIPLVILALAIGTPILFFIQTWGYTILIALIANLSLGFARVVLWVITILIFIPIMIQIHLMAIVGSHGILARLPSRITVATLIAISAILCISGLIRQAAGFPS